MKGINWLGLVLALVVGQAIGFAWYGLIFEERWLELSGVDPAMSSNLAMVWGAVATLVTVFGLALAIPRLGMATLNGGATVGFGAAVFFAITTIAMDWIYGKDVIDLAALDAGYVLIYYTIAGALIGGVRMPRKAA